LSPLLVRGQLRPVDTHAPGGGHSDGARERHAQSGAGGRSRDAGLISAVLRQGASQRPFREQQQQQHCAPTHCGHRHVAVERSSAPRREVLSPHPRQAKTARWTTLDNIVRSGRRPVAACGFCGWCERYPWVPCCPDPHLLESRQSVATPQAVRRWARPPCRHIKIQYCCCLGSGSRWRSTPNLGHNPGACWCCPSSTTPCELRTACAGDQPRATMGAAWHAPGDTALTHNPEGAVVS
jgi:hypothetical protein